MLLILLALIIGALLMAPICLLTRALVGGLKVLLRMVVPVIVILIIIVAII